MKLFKTTILFGGLLALAMSVNAQSPIIQVNVPFEFVAGSTTMPAGAYTIEEPTTHGVLLLRGSQHNATAVLIAVNGGPSNATHAGLTFSRRGGASILSGVSVPGGSNYAVVMGQDKTSTALSVLPRK